MSFSKLGFLRVALLGASLAACTHTKQPQLIGPELGQSTASGPSDVSRPNPPPQAGAIAGGPSQSIRGVGNAPVIVGSAGAPANPEVDTSNNTMTYQGSDNAIANGSTPDASSDQTVTNPVGGLTPSGVAPATTTGTTGTTPVTGPVSGAAPNGPGTGTGPATPTGPATGTGTPTPGTGAGTATPTTPTNPGGGTSTTGGSGR